MRWTGQIETRNSREQIILIEILKRRGHFGNDSADEKIILKLFLKKIRCNVDRIKLAQDRNQWRAVVITVVNLMIHKSRTIYTLAERLSDSKEVCASSNKLCNPLPYF